jgi:hypothetical protein
MFYQEFLLFYGLPLDGGLRSRHLLASKCLYNSFYIILNLQVWKNVMADSSETKLKSPPEDGIT